MARCLRDRSEEADVKAGRCSAIAVVRTKNVTTPGSHAEGWVRNSPGRRRTWQPQHEHDARPVRGRIHRPTAVTATPVEASRPGRRTCYLRFCALRRRPPQSLQDWGLCIGRHSHGAGAACRFISERNQHHRADGHCRVDDRGKNPCRCGAVPDDSHQIAQRQLTANAPTPMAATALTAQP